MASIQTHLLIDFFNEKRVQIEIVFIRGRRYSLDVEGVESSSASTFCEEITPSSRPAHSPWDGRSLFEVTGMLEDANVEQPDAR